MLFVAVVGVLWNLVFIGINRRLAYYNIHEPQDNFKSTDKLVFDDDDNVGTVNITLLG